MDYEDRGNSLIAILLRHPVRNALLATPPAIYSLLLGIAWAWTSFTDKKIPDWISEQLWWQYMTHHMLITGLIAIIAIAIYVLIIWIIFRHRPLKETEGIKIGFMRPEDNPEFIRGLSIGISKLLEQKRQQETQNPIKLKFLNNDSNWLKLLVSNYGENEQRLINVRLSLVHESGEVENMQIRALHRCEKLPYIMPPKSSFEVDFRTSINGLMAFNQTKDSAPQMKVKELFATVDFEVGESIVSDRQSIPEPVRLKFSVDFLPSKNPTHVGTYIRIINHNDSKPLKIQSLKVIGVWDGNEESFIDKPGLFQDDNETPCEIPPEDRRDFIMSFSESQVWNLDKTLLAYYGQLELRDGRTFKTDIVKRPTPPSSTPDMSKISPLPAS